ncbi:response regulator transcription factor [Robertmurraya yapensis]|uniref:Response regulator transcription factor n=1 Tax=Bacillus yapensis TaxID=2492960 RepID=A0A3S0KD82_9BACI|nr:response regulator transcription factor [Bacillus yapensis]RTR28160.1 response regulator transcription factor [Bacillus yapensis]TKS94403.1 response regulator [Bacillus yapensis]
MKKILVVEDERYMMNLLKIHLGNDYDFVEAKDGQTAIDLILEESFDVIILDVMLPYVSGWEVCKKIREEDEEVPVLMLTARSELSDKVMGLEIGADDYLVKPFEFEELKARIRALLRRYEHSKHESSEENKCVYYNDLFRMDIDSRQLFVNQQYIELTAKEFDLLSVLASNPNRVFTREILLDKIWEINEIRDLRNVDTHIKNIRIKLKKAVEDINFIQTVWGVGYKFNLLEDMK